MRVLKDNILVQINIDTDNELFKGDDKRRGIVKITGSDQVSVGEEVLFGEKFEEIELEKRSNSRYYLMHETNIKVIYDFDPNTPQENKQVLPFFKKAM